MKMKVYELPSWLQVGDFYETRWGIACVLEINEEKVLGEAKGYAKIIYCTGEMSWVSFSIFKEEAKIEAKEVDIEVRSCLRRIGDLSNAVKSWKKKVEAQWSEIQDLKNEIRALEHGKFTVLEVNQWTAAEGLKDLSISDFEDGPDLGRHFYIMDVYGDQRPSIGMVWFRENEDGKLEQWKYNYDTSD